MMEAEELVDCSQMLRLLPESVAVTPSVRSPRRQPVRGNAFSYCPVITGRLVITPGLCSSVLLSRWPLFKVEENWFATGLLSYRSNICPLAAVVSDC